MDKDEWRARRIRAARALAGWSQADLSAAAGLSGGVIFKAETGKRIMLDSFEKIVAAFDKAGVILTETGVDTRKGKDTPG